MQRTFLSNLTLLMLLNLLIKPCYLLLVEAEIQNRVGAEVFGNYSALISLTFLLNIFLDLGINNYTSRTVAQSKNVVVKHLEHIAGLRFLLFAGYMFLLLILAMVLGYHGEDISLLIWLGINQTLAVTLLYFRANLGGLLMFRKDALISILDRGLLLLGLGALLLYHKEDNYFDIYWLVKGQTVAYALTLLLALFFVLSKTGKIRIKWKINVQRAIVKQSLPYALLFLLTMVYYKTDSIMLERMLPRGDFFAGIYAKGYRIFEASNLLGFLFATLLLPLFSRALKAKENVSDLAGNAFRLMIAGSSILVGLSALFPGFLLGIIYDNEIQETVPVFVTLMISFAFMLMTYLWGTLLTANGNLKSLNIIAVCAVGLNISLNFILIPRYQAWGSAIASLVTQIAVTTIQAVLCYRYNIVQLLPKVWLKTAVFLIVFGTLSYFITIIPIQIEFKVLSYPLIGLASAIAVGLLRIVDIRSLISDRVKGG